MESENGMKFPTHEDLEGSAVALLRLQDTYKLKTDEIAEGKIQGTKRADKMNGKNKTFSNGNRLGNLGNSKTKTD